MTDFALWLASLPTWSQGVMAGAFGAMWACFLILSLREDVGKEWRCYEKRKRNN